MSEAFIVGAVRTPVGRRGGGLSEWHPADLAAAVIVEALARSGLEADLVDDVIFGCVDQVGAQAGNVARTAWLSAGLPEHVPGTTVDRQCGSSQQAVHFAAQGILAGAYEVVVAGGVEVMSLVPLLASSTCGPGLGYREPLDGVGWRGRYGPGEISQFRGAELMIDRWGLEADELQEFAVASHARASAAWDDGAFDAEVMPIGGVTRDEGVRADTSIAQIAALPALQDGGRLTAALCSQVSDGAAALVLASERAVAAGGLVPMARVHAMAVAGSDPVLMLGGPIPATQRVLARGGLEIGAIERFEVNEAFASVPLCWAAETGASLQRTNVNGGAIALGHPLGATGARLMVTLVHELRRSQKRYGLQAICEWGGTANATIIERL